jgi:hypothetical protein
MSIFAGKVEPADAAPAAQRFERSASAARRGSQSTRQRRHASTSK